jgi:acyl-CoA hydrolase
MGIGDANVAGNVHGDVIMYLCDEAAGIAALRHSGRRAVTAAMDRVNFLSGRAVVTGSRIALERGIGRSW